MNWTVSLISFDQLILWSSEYPDEVEHIAVHFLMTDFDFNLMQLGLL